MKAFAWVVPKDLPSAAAAMADGGLLLAGGIDALSLLKQGLVAPTRVVNLKAVAGLDQIEVGDELRVGALVTLRALAADPTVRTAHAALGEAAAAVGSPQIRNVGTVGGNLCQRPRCWYFRDHEVECLKKGGSVCYAEEGRNELHAIFGGGPCHIVHPSDLAPALLALDASVVIAAPLAGTTRRVPVADFFVSPAKDATRETALARGEIVTAVALPSTTRGWKSSFFKMKERESFDWTLVAAAVALDVAEGVVVDVRVALGGVAPVPWRSSEAEAALRGRPLSDATALAAGRAACEAARPLAENGYKKKLVESAVRIAALRAAGQETP